MVGCVSSQLKPSELYILSCEKSLGLRPQPFSHLRMLSSSGFILYRMSWSDEENNVLVCFKNFERPSTSHNKSLHSGIWDVGYNTYCHLFDSFVVPVQDYACEIWWNSNINMCDKITERAMRYYLGVHNLTPLPALYGEMGWLKTKYRHYIHVIRF